MECLKKEVDRLKWVLRSFCFFSSSANPLRISLLLLRLPLLLLGTVGNPPGREGAYMPCFPDAHCRRRRLKQTQTARDATGMGGGHGTVALASTVNGPITVVHSNFQEPALDFIMRNIAGHIDFQPMLDFSKKISVDHINMWIMCVIILFCVTFVLWLIFNMLVETLHEDVWEHPGILDPRYN